MPARGELAAAVVQQTRGERKSHLIGVSNPVFTGEPVLAKELREAEGGPAGVEARQVVLAVVRDEQVVDSWFDGVGERLAEEGNGTFEEQTAVETEAWKQPRWGVVRAASVAVRFRL